MRAWWGNVAAALIGCGAPHQTLPADAAPIDAGLDTGCTSDRDGDGVCDDVDDCPDTYDPAQADPDGDGIGWACDSVETITVTFDSVPMYAYANQTLASQTYGATVVGQVSATVSEVTAVAVSPLGFVIENGDDGTPMTAWAANNDILGPLISPDGSLYWSRTGAYDTGALDITTGAFTSLAAGVDEDEVSPNGALSVVALRQSPSNSSANLYAGSEGALVSLAANEFPISSPYGYLYAVGSPAVTAVPLFDGTTYELAKLSAGETGLTPIATGLDDLEAIPLGIPFPEIGFCAATGASTTYIGIGATSVTMGPLPFSSCATIQVRLSALIPNFAILFSFSETGSGFDTAYVRDGVVGPLVSGVTDLYVAGDHLLALIDGSNVWALSPTGTVTQLPTTGLANVSVSAHADTIHVAGIQPTTNGLGHVVVIRYRDATGAQQVTLPASVDAAIAPTIFTSAEGAAIVLDGVTWTFASESMTPMQWTNQFNRGWVFGSTTMLQAFVPPSSSDVLFAYDEVGGSSRFTQFTPGGVYAPDALTEPPDAWFQYQTAATPCAWGTIDASGGTPALAVGIDCPVGQDQGAFQGRTLDGTIVATAGDYIYLLSPTRAVLAAHGTQLSFLRDQAQPGRTIVGWIGTDALGPFACLASHPERCWSVPAGSQQLEASANEPTSNGSFALSVQTTTGAVSSISISRSLGLGDRPQPIP